MSVVTRETPHIDGRMVRVTFEKMASGTVTNKGGFYDVVNGQRVYVRGVYKGSAINGKHVWAFVPTAFESLAS